MIQFLGIANRSVNDVGDMKLDYDTLIEACETGDILLFQSRGFIPCSIRRITNARYDHVGVVVVRNPDGGGKEKCFLEASGDKYGVCIHNMEERMLEWHLSNARITYRRLRCVRDDIFEENTSKFLDLVNGSKYGFSFKSMLLNERQAARRQE